MEKVVRKHLNDQNMLTHMPGTDVRKIIQQEVLKSPVILSQWETIAQPISAKYEKYSIELLTIITDLWITIRVHSFAKEWTMKFQRKYQSGTRKSLQTRQDN